MFAQINNQELRLDELQALLRAVGRFDSADKMQELISSIDENTRSEGFTFQLFINLIHKGISDLKQGTIKQYFDFLDIDESGKISAEELRLCLQDLGLGLSEREIEQMLESVFENKDQQLSYEDFSQHIKKVIW